MLAELKANHRMMIQSTHGGAHHKLAAASGALFRGGIAKGSACVRVAQECASVCTCVRVRVSTRVRACV